MASLYFIDGEAGLSPNVILDYYSRSFYRVTEDVLSLVDAPTPL